MTPGDIVRHRRASWRVLTIEGTAATVYGGPRWQTRTLPASELTPATRRQRDDFERAAEKVRAALRSIPAARPVR